MGFEPPWWQQAGFSSPGEFHYYHQEQQRQQEWARLAEEQRWNALTPEQRQAELAQRQAIEDARVAAQAAAAERERQRALEEQRAHDRQVAEVLRRTTPEGQRQALAELRKARPLAAQTSERALLSRSQNPIFASLLMIGWLVGLAVVGTAAGAFLATAVIPLAILSGPLRARRRSRRIERAQERVQELSRRLGCGEPACAACAPLRA